MEGKGGWGDELVITVGEVGGASTCLVGIVNWARQITLWRVGVVSQSPCRFNIFTGCPEAKTCTIILRGGAEQFIEETERSLHDAIMIVRRTIKNDAVVAGEVTTL